MSDRKVNPDVQKKLKHVKEEFKRLGMDEYEVEESEESLRLRVAQKRLGCGLNCTST